MWSKAQASARCVVSCFPLNDVKNRHGGGGGARSCNRRSISTAVNWWTPLLLLLVQLMRIITDDDDKWLRWLGTRSVIDHCSLSVVAAQFHYRRCFQPSILDQISYSRTTSRCIRTGIITRNVFLLYVWTHICTNIHHCTILIEPFHPNHLRYHLCGHYIN